MSLFENFDFIESKRDTISKALELKNLDDIKAAAIESGGLLTEGFRQRCWPLLSGVSSQEVDVISDEHFFNGISENSDFINHPDWSVVTADVNRSVMWFDDVENIEEMKEKLTKLIMAVILDDKELCYFQGYNVICAVLLRIMDNDSFLAFRLAKAVTSIHFRHLMLDRKGEKMWDFLSYIFPIIGRKNRSLRDFLENADLRETVCISWILTWLGYHIGSISLEEIYRLFDFFLACGEKYMPVYFSASLILLHAEGITQCHPEMTEVFQYVKSIPESIPIEEVIKNSIKLQQEVPLKEVEFDAGELIRSRNEQQMSFRAVHQNRLTAQRLTKWWYVGNMIYNSSQVRLAAASSLALGVAYWYSRNPDALDGVLRILRNCANTATINVIGIDIDFLLG